MKKLGKAAAAVAAIVLGLSLFAGCSDSDSGGSKKKNYDYYTATLVDDSGNEVTDDTGGLADYTVTVTVQSGNVTGVTVSTTDDSGNTVEYEADATDDSDVWSVIVDGTEYMITTAGSGSTWTYTYETGSTTQAKYGSSGTDELSGYTIMVTVAGS